MRDGFEVDTDMVRPGAAGLSDAAEGLAAAVTTWASVLAECEGMIGGDKFGQVFAKEYDPACKQVHACAEHVAQLLAGVSRGVIGMADGYDVMEDKNARRLRPDR